MKGKISNARLILEDGSEFLGQCHGHEASVAGEVVFTTGMMGYPQSLTDPSFKGQILVATYPFIGNYGVPGPELGPDGISRHFESDQVQVTALVVAEYCEEASHYQSQRNLGAWLKSERVPLLSGIDTRALTERLRARGVMRGKILVEGRADVEMDSGDIANSVDLVSVKEPKVYTPVKVDRARIGEGLRVCLVDYGVKNNILRCFLARGVTVIQVPWDHNLRGLEWDGLFLSNGPGDPKALGKSVEHVRWALEGDRPIFGICMGNHVIGLASGGDTYKLPFGHRSQNQPCVELGTDRCYITSQNHGYAVRAESLKPEWGAWFVNGNDGTVEGLRHREKPFFSVQFHPEGCPGPRDSEYLFDEFIKAMVKARGAK